MKIFTFNKIQYECDDDNAIMITLDTCDCVWIFDKQIVEIHAMQKCKTHNTLNAALRTNRAFNEGKTEAQMGAAAVARAANKKLPAFRKKV